MITISLVINYALALLIANKSTELKYHADQSHFHQQSAVWLPGRSAGPAHQSSVQHRVPEVMSLCLSKQYPGSL